MPRRTETEEESATDTETELLALECACGRSVELRPMPEYELPTFLGACPCGRVWSLTELSRRGAAGPETES